MELARQANANLRNASPTIFSLQHLDDAVGEFANVGGSFKASLAANSELSLPSVVAGRILNSALRRARWFRRCHSLTPRG